MVSRRLICRSCDKQYPFTPRFTPCDACHGPLDVDIDIQEALNRVSPRAFDDCQGGMSKFAPFFAVSNEEEFVTLGEGGTPLLRHSRLNALVGMPNLLIKNEAANPTWSFKDRLNAVNASLAREFGFRDLVAVSTGNHGASASAYAAAAGIRNVIFLAHGAPEIYGQMVQAYGGSALLTDWHGSANLLAHLVKERGWYPSKSSLPSPISNPFGLQGYKSIAFEIAIALRRRVPDYMLVPVGSGDDIYGTYKGFFELRELGIVDHIPTFVGCESATANPLARSLAANSDHIEKIKDPQTMAISIGAGICSDHALRAVRGSGGFACSPSDAEIKDAMRLYSSVGLVAESASCVSLAAARRLLAEGRIPEDAVTVVVLTSAGIKWPQEVASLGSPPVSMPARTEELDALLDDVDGLP
ncbi:MAG: pyridoxal-phosphate dependent enzyme [Mesorhizobium sp.]|uniref:threonine synthase n=1 Tax=Mesorhizobium sp. TaxID=1871066 RepID=UPI000FE4C386|nr:pyridoxal-phosphate dependent enzyme [Mesorhizobium sp.]RWI34669.1 MAG: pyridoxal-phosphate dependent enzyme [Mesorhizobium sp.]RWI62819.1 MAG: pyridoxal-phosphate dependent enzyme [Mesorhizobium sp.]RWI81353.1 MAG: pyridoxal-phosphate dependent enzyme [Mesorhizobium sp.]RWJ42139.1 MAG: pyridoxal-phosphate dependent enzyme [Mesorhizobium sp.]RWJ56968.1 MAG: pyridoxal-phosphate dependent enzyme [Mesorhizobium sp.]